MLCLVLRLEFERVCFLQQRNAFIGVERAGQIASFEALLEGIQTLHIPPCGHQIGLRALKTRVVLEALHLLRNLCLGNASGTPGNGYSVGLDEHVVERGVGQQRQLAETVQTCSKRRLQFGTLRGVDNLIDRRLGGEALALNAAGKGFADNDMFGTEGR
ncbi:hypothetical protein D9M72_476750 [compost metagenome]